MRRSERSSAMRDIVAFYRNADQAREARDELISAGFDNSDVKLYDQPGTAGRSTPAGVTTGEQHPGLLERIKEWFGFADEEDQHLYSEAARRGNCALSVRVPDDEDAKADDVNDADDRSATADMAIMILRRHDPIDLDVESEQWRAQGWAGTPAATTTQPQARTGGMTSSQPQAQAQS